MFKYSKKIEHLDLYRPDMVLRGRHKVKMKLLYSNKGKSIEEFLLSYGKFIEST